MKIPYYRKKSFTNEQIIEENPLPLDRGGNKRGPEGSCMYSSIGEGRPSDAGGPRFDPTCLLFHQIHPGDAFALAWWKFD